MKLKNRMVISFFVIILVPLILTGVAVAGFTMYQVWSLEKKYGIEGVTYENLSNNTMLLSKMTQKTFSTLEKTASSDPEKLEETSYLNSLNQDLTGKNAYLLIRKGNDMFYCGSPTQDELLFSELPEYGDPSADNDRGVYIGADVQSLIKQVVNGMSLPYPKHIWSSTDPVTGCWDCYLSIALPCRDLVTDGCLQWQELWNWSCVQQQLFCW